ncbi:30S ribosomal protein S17 [Candidatus Bathyarchaeota archaeon]|jgi:small subunit ribosomal protein S17|nr:30S ribosomal protein S17 [Candidatus Bathyarchaeota archaeon]MDP6049157.1 30S ribosomal protein S17 [Candidatus Bathyarchaeota archaeon]MDP6458562.1 30S ribosomal protein S17 [Candidatus Bathyarchaeota archaeon]MDP7207061.1 30S ribosomal protein S17 [Candidatus Bathyarchaeota archaeon]MDP7443977.1 30S ribosomal protein S17 [Candidatus Bathyarchaeota archaeon]|tara:strand:+ start:2749 stop:3054 length:306 start_codon:yes stop_codon:yes gene_type:complete
MMSFKEPETKCDDIDCPFHGNLSTRGRILEGTVMSDKMAKSVIISIEYTKYYPKYERYARLHNRIPAHNPPCIDARRGDKVKIAECRPLSKTKTFVVVEKE